MILPSENGVPPCIFHQLVYNDGWESYTPASCILTAVLRLTAAKSMPGRQSQSFTLVFAAWEISSVMSLFECLFKQSSRADESDAAWDSSKLSPIQVHFQRMQPFKFCLYAVLSGGNVVIRWRRIKIFLFHYNKAMGGDHFYELGFFNKVHSWNEIHFCQATV